MKVQRQVKDPLLDSQQDKAMLQKCKLTIEELQEELNEARDSCEQQKKLIDILTKEKEYYYEECFKHEEEKARLENQRMNAVREYETKRVLVNELKKANQTLKEELYETNQALEENKFMFHAQEQQIERIKNEKHILEKEWNRVIKQIKAKFVINSQGNLSFEKENSVNQGNVGRKEKVSKILEKIDKTLAEKEIDWMIHPTKKDSSTNQISDISF